MFPYRHPLFVCLNLHTYMKTLNNCYSKFMQRQHCDVSKIVKNIFQAAGIDLLHFVN